MYRSTEEQQLRHKLTTLKGRIDELKESIQRLRDDQWHLENEYHETNYQLIQLPSLLGMQANKDVLLRLLKYDFTKLEDKSVLWKVKDRMWTIQKENNRNFGVDPRSADVKQHLVVIKYDDETKFEVPFENIEDTLGQLRQFATTKLG